jgi:hypothetical protein
MGQPTFRKGVLSITSKDAKAVVTSSPRRLLLHDATHAYELDDQMVAIHGALGQKSGVLTFESDEIVVQSVDDTEALSEGDAVGPVYRRVPGGGITVPTGRVLVEFSDADEARSHHEDLTRMGFIVETSLSYAPQAVWVRGSGPIGDTLNRLSLLESVPGVKGVDPQMLGEPSRR